MTDVLSIGGRPQASGARRCSTDDRATPSIASELATLTGWSRS